MTDRNLLQAMGHIDPVLIAEASPDVPYKKKTTQAWVKWAAVAASFVLAIAVCIVGSLIIDMVRILENDLPPS